MATTEVSINVPPPKPLKAEDSEAIDLSGAKDPSNPFDVTPDDLASLIDPHKDKHKLARLGGCQAILKALHVDPEMGVQSMPGEDDDFQLHKKVEKSKSLFSLHKSESQAGLVSGRPEVEGITKALRRKVFGKNQLPELRQKNIFDFIKDAFQDKILILLTVAAFVSLAIGIYEDTKPLGPNASEADKQKIHWIEGFAIIVAVLIVVLSSSINDLQKEAQFRKLNAKKEDRQVKAIRDGQQQLISIYGIVVGDILLLEPGDVIPAD
ncbi:plasma membrane calcium, partial [Chytridiales sp. JEL 0842]